MTSKPSFYEATNRYQKVTPHFREQNKRKYAYNYAETLPQSRSAHMLDLGCSEGIALEWLVDSGYQNVVGIDSDFTAVEFARHRLRSRVPEEQIVHADIREYLKEQKDRSVDRIFMFNVIEHLEKSFLLEVLPEIHRLLKPGGAFLAQTGNIENPFNLGLYARDFTHQIPFTTNSLKQALIMGGFAPETISVKGVKYVPTLRNWPLQISGPLVGWAIKKIAFAMRMRIEETSSLIYCLARR